MPTVNYVRSFSIYERTITVLIANFVCWIIIKFSLQDRKPNNMSDRDEAAEQLSEFKKSMVRFYYD